MAAAVVRARSGHSRASSPSRRHHQPTSLWTLACDTAAEKSIGLHVSTLGHILCPRSVQPQWHRVTRRAYFQRERYLGRARVVALPTASAQ